MNCNFTNKIFFLLSIFLIGVSSITAQTLTTQAEVDAFDPSITEITGSLTISGDDIVNIDALSNVTMISGWLSIRENEQLVNIDGLSNVTEVAGTLIIDENGLLTNVNGLSSVSNISGTLRIGYFDGNASLSNIDGLSNVSDLTGELTIEANMSLTNVDGLSSLTEITGILQIDENNALANIDGLSNVIAVPGTLEIGYVFGNPSLVNIDGLSKVTSISGVLRIEENDILANVDGLSSIIEVIGIITIENNDGMTDIDGLSNITNIAGTLTIEGNDGITNVDGLSSITEITGQLSIDDNDEITNIDGLSNLTEIIGTLEIGNFRGNSALTNINGLNNFTEITGTLTIHGNDALANINGLSNVENIVGTLNIDSNGALMNVDDLIMLTNIVGLLTIEGNASLANVDGLNNLTEITGTLEIGDLFGNSSLTNVNGLSNVTDVTGTLTIGGNDALTNIDGLSNITEIVGTIEIGGFTGNDVLTNINGLSNVTNIIGSLLIDGNDGLLNIDGLSNMTNIIGTLFIDENASLTNIDGLLNLKEVTGILEIGDFLGNSSLTNVDGLINITKIEGTVLIEGNDGITNVDGLINLTEITGTLAVGDFFGNELLTNIDGLSNISEITGTLRIIGNNSLDICCSVFPILSSGVYNQINIGNNSNSCNSIEEILNSDCGLVLRYEQNSPCIGVDNGSIELSAINYDTIPFNYNWEHEESGATGAFTTNDDIYTLENLVEGTYNVTLTQPNGDIARARDIVLDPILGASFEITELTSVNSVNAMANGSISINFDGGQAPYIIDWSGAASGSESSVTSDSYTLSNIPPGEYNISITDANNIQLSIDVTLLDETISLIDCEVPMDIIVLNLVSVAINADEYKKSKPFFYEFFESINLGNSNNESRVAIAEWSGREEQDLKIPITGSLSELGEYEEQERSYSGSTGILDALEYGSEYLRNNARPNAQKVIIFTFDGCTSFSAAAYAEELKEEGFIIADIGIDYANNSGNYRGLLTKAATTPDLALFASNFDQVDPLILHSRLTLVACPGSSSSAYFDRDGAIEIDNIETQFPCPYPSTIDITFTVEALMQISIPAGTPVTFYHNNPTLYGATPISTFIIPCSISPGTSETFTITLDIETATHLYAVLNDDGMTSPAFELPVTDINEAQYSNNIDDERICTDGFATLQALKSSTSLSPICEGIAQYTIDVCNISDVDATGVSIQDEAAAGFVLLQTIVNDNGCSTEVAGLYNIPSGCCVSLTLNYDISAADFGYYGDQDVYLSGPVDQTYLDFEGENTTSEDVLIDGEENCGSNVVIFTKEVDLETTCEDHSLTYTFTIDNQSSNALIGVEFTDIIPAPLEWVYKPYNKEGLSISTSNITDQSATFTIDEIEAETIASFIIDVYVGATDIDVLVNNTATLSNLPSYINDGTQTINSNTVSTTVLADREISLLDTIYVDASQNTIALDAIISGTSGIVWTTTGDGTFSDPSISNPIYELGPEDLTDTLFALFVEVSTYCGQKGNSIFIKRLCDLELTKEENSYCALDVNGGSATLTWSGGIGPYNIEGDLTAEDISSPYTIENLAVGSYDIILLDEMGCSDIATLVIDTFPRPSVTIVSQDEHCDQGDGSIEMTISGGTGPYQISGTETWTDIVSVLTINDLSADEYSFIITDQNGCASEEMIEIKAEAGPTINHMIATPDCGELPSSYTLDWAGGVGPYTLSGSITESSAASTLVINSPAVGAYSITITDAFGCVDSTSFDLAIADTPEVSLEANCTSVEEYIIQITTGNYTVISDQGYTVESLGNGAYQITNVDIFTSLSITVTDDDTGCDTILLVTPPDCDCTAFADAGQDQFITCVDNAVLLGGSGTSNGNNYTYSWLDMDGNWLGSEINYLTETSGLYQLEVVDLEFDCISLDSVEVQDIREDPLAEINTDQSLALTCLQSSIELTATHQDNATYSWQFPTANDPLSGVVISATDDGQIILTVIDTISGCQSQDSISITLDTLSPLVVIVPPLVLNCANDMVELDGSLSDAGDTYNYQWLDSLGDEIIEETNATMTTSEMGNYSLLVTNTANGCDAIGATSVSENYETPQITLADDLQMDCLEDSYILVPDIASTSDNLNISWYRDSDTEIGQNSTLEVDSAGLYFIVVVDQVSECIALDSILLLPSDGITSAAISVEEISCFEDDNASIEVTEIDGGLIPLTYSLDGNENQIGLFSDLPSGSYELSIIDNNGCRYDSTITILQPIDLELESDLENYTVSLNDEITVQLSTNLDEQDIESIVWNPAINCDNCLNVTFTDVKEDQSYTVTLTDVNGCIVTTQFNLSVSVGEGIYLPNIIAAGSSSNNSIFYPKSSEPELIILEMNIYDRWGSLVYTSSNFNPNDPSAGWDGSYKGKEAMSGVYVYYIQTASTQTESKVYTGDVTVIR